MEKQVFRISFLIINFLFFSRAYSQYTVIVNATPGSPSVVCTNTTVVLFAGTSFTGSGIYYTWTGSTFPMPINQSSITVGPGSYTVSAFSGNDFMGYQAVDVGLCTGMNESDSRIQSVTVFPNPVKDVLKVSVKDTGDYYSSIQLFTITGQEIYSESRFDLRNGINISTCDPGMYYLVLQKEQFQQTVKIVKE